MGSTDTTLTAVFERDGYNLTLSEGLVASYSVTDEFGNTSTRKTSGSMTIVGDTRVTVTPKPGYVADSGEWLVNGVSVGSGLSQYEFVITGNTTVSAPVTRKDYLVSLSITPEGKGNKVRVYAGGILNNLSDNIPGGTKLEFEALPARGYVFDHWEIGDKDAGNDLILTVDYLEQNLDVKAVFVEDANFHTVTLTAGSNGSVQYTIKYDVPGNAVTIEDEVKAGTTRTITVYSADELTVKANPRKTYILRNWMVNGEIVENQTTLYYQSVDKNLSVNARFIAASSARFIYSLANLSPGYQNNSVEAYVATDDGYQSIESGSMVANGEKIVINARPGSGQMVAYWVVNDNVIYGENGWYYVGETLEINEFIADERYEVYVYFTTMTQHTVTFDVTNAEYEFESGPDYTNRSIGDGSKFNVRRDGWFSLSLRPKAGYYFAELKLNGENVNPDADGIYRFGIDPVYSTYGNFTVYARCLPVLSIDVTPKDGSVDKGGTLKLGATVAGADNPSQKVAWTVKGNTSGNTWIDEDGVLHVDYAEEAESLTITATSEQDGKFYASVTVRVTTPAPVVTGVKVAPDSASVEKGKAKQFSSEVIGWFGPPQGVVWTVTGNTSSGTTISADGVLTIGIDETADTLTVTATSVYDSRYKDSVTVTVVTPPPVVSGVTVTPTDLAVEKGKTQKFSSYSVVGITNKSSFDPVDNTDPKDDSGNNPDDNTGTNPDENNKPEPTKNTEIKPVDNPNTSGNLTKGFYGLVISMCLLGFIGFRSDRKKRQFGFLN